jgi:hypothetical protein
LMVTEPENILNNNLSPYGMASRSCQSSYDWYVLSGNDEKYFMPHNLAEMTPGWSNCAACLLTAPRLYLDCAPELTQNWGQINPNVNDCHSDPIENSRSFRLPDITDWWQQQEGTHSTYPDLSNVVCAIFSIIPYGVGAEASVSLSWDVIRRRRSKPTGETLPEMIVVRQFARSNNGLLAGDDP